MMRFLVSFFFLLSLTVPLGSTVFADSAREELQYAIKKFGASAGSASLTFHDQEELNGQKVYCVIFIAKAFNFLDQEKIYIDPKNFYPMMVKRDLNIFGKKERITEYYDHAKGELKVVKEVKGKEVSQILKKQGPIDNLYCFLYRFRQGHLPSEGASLIMKLPTKDVTIEFKGKENLTIGRQKVEAYVLESNPKQYKIWFTTDSARAPLRIDGAMGIISSSLVLKELP